MEYKLVNNFANYNCCVFFSFLFILKLHCDNDDEQSWQIVLEVNEIFSHLHYRPVSAYALFFRDTQASIKGQNPNASFGEVSKIVASMWDVLAPDHKNVSMRASCFII